MSSHRIMELFFVLTMATCLFMNWRWTQRRKGSPEKPTDRFLLPAVVILGVVWIGFVVTER
jgi:hypothetical protein